MPCLSSRPCSALNESTRVSKAESQLAVPLAMTTFLGESVIGSPKGSAVWTDGAGAGAPAADGAGEADGLASGLAEGAGAGVALGDALGAALGAELGVAAGACASAPPIPSQIVAAAIVAARARRGRKGRVI